MPIPTSPPIWNSIVSVRKAETGRPIFLALTDNNVTVTKARRLREAGVDEVLPVSITGPELTWAHRGSETPAWRDPDGHRPDR